MRNADAEKTLRTAVKRTTPDALAAVFKKIERAEASGYIAVSERIAKNAQTSGAQLDPAQADGVPRGSTAGDAIAYAASAARRRQSAGSPTFFVQQPRRRASPWIVASRAAFAALAIYAGIAAYGFASSHIIGSLVMLDVNPSIELRLNGADRVVEAAAKNEAAAKTLGDMDLRQVPVDVAVNAIVGSMLTYGYIKEDSNSLLLTVESFDDAKRVALQQELAGSISLRLGSVNGAVISQNLAKDEAIVTLAREHGISDGKAALVSKILANNSHLSFDGLAALSVNELNLLIGSKGIVAEGMEASGSASDQAFIGEERAKQAALAHVGAGANDVAWLEAELDYDDGLMVYEVEFVFDGREHELEVDAKDASILESDSRAEMNSGSPHISGGGRDGANGAGNNGYSGDGANGAGNGTSGTAATAGAGIGGVSNGGNGSAKTNSGTAPEFIGEEAAIAAALTHSGATGAERSETDLDKDDGIYVYDVEFKSGGIEYDYEIDAITGDVISWESEAD